MSEGDIEKHTHNIEVLRRSLGTANMRLRRLGGDPVGVRFRAGVYIKVERGEEKVDGEEQVLPDQHDKAMMEDDEDEDEAYTLDELLAQYPPYADDIGGLKVWSRVDGFHYTDGGDIFEFWQHLTAWIPRFRVLPVLLLQISDEIDVFSGIRGKLFEEALADLHALRHSKLSVALQLTQHVSSRVGGGPDQLWCVAPHSHSVLFAWVCRCRRGVSPFPDAD